MCELVLAPAVRASGPTVGIDIASSCVRADWVSEGMRSGLRLEAAAFDAECSFVMAAAFDAERRLLLRMRTRILDLARLSFGLRSAMAGRSAAMAGGPVS